MSNVTVATPYVATASMPSTTTSSNTGAEVGAAIASAVACTAIVTSWLCAKDEHDLAARDGHRVTEREQRIGLPIEAVRLHCRDADTLVVSAAKLGYTAQKLDNGTGILLRRGDGERLALISTTSGLVMHTSGPRSLAHELVRQHVVDGTERYLRSRGLTPTVRNRGSEVEVIATEASAATKNPADVSARVYVDGRVRLDIDCTGNKCEVIRDELIADLGLQVEADKKKEAFFTLPGEPTRTSMRV